MFIVFESQLVAREEENPIKGPISLRRRLTPSYTICALLYIKFGLGVRHTGQAGGRPGGIGLTKIEDGYFKSQEEILF
jgi:hypothetical protein